MGGYTHLAFSDVDWLNHLTRQAEEIAGAHLNALRDEFTPEIAAEIKAKMAITKPRKAGQKRKFSPGSSPVPFPSIPAAASSTLAPRIPVAPAPLPLTSEAAPSTLAQLIPVAAESKLSLTEREHSEWHNWTNEERWNSYGQHKKINHAKALQGLPLYLKQFSPADYSYRITHSLDAGEFGLQDFIGLIKVTPIV